MYSLSCYTSLYAILVPLPLPKTHGLMIVCRMQGLNACLYEQALIVELRPSWVSLSLSLVKLEENFTIHNRIQHSRTTLGGGEEEEEDGDEDISSWLMTCHVMSHSFPPRNGWSSSYVISFHIVKGPDVFHISKSLFFVTRLVLFYNSFHNLLVWLTN